MSAKDLNSYESYSDGPCR